MHHTKYKGHRQKQCRELVSEGMHRRENARRVGSWQVEILKTGATTDEAGCQSQAVTATGFFDFEV
jgi:hypothetical protein